MKQSHWVFYLVFQVDLWLLGVLLSYATTSTQTTCIREATSEIMMKNTRNTTGMSLPFSNIACSDFRS